jgi:hypothetical protein
MAPCLCVIVSELFFCYSMSTYLQFLLFMFHLLCRGGCPLLCASQEVVSLSQCVPCFFSPEPGMPKWHYPYVVNPILVMGFTWVHVFLYG